MIAGSGRYCGLPEITCKCVSRAGRSKQRPYSKLRAKGWEGATAHHEL